VAKMAVLIRVY